MANANNDGRAKAAMVAVKAFAATPYGELVGGKMGGDLLRQNIGDLMSDLMHLCKQKDIDFDDVLSRATDNFSEERN